MIESIVDILKNDKDGDKIKDYVEHAEFFKTCFINERPDYEKEDFEDIFRFQKCLLYVLNSDVVDFYNKYSHTGHIYDITINTTYKEFEELIDTEVYYKYEEIYNKRDKKKVKFTYEMNLLRKYNEHLIIDFYKKLLDAIHTINNYKKQQIKEIVNKSEVSIDNSKSAEIDTQETINNRVNEFIDYFINYSNASNQFYVLLWILLLNKNYNITEYDDEVMNDVNEILKQYELKPIEKDEFVNNNDKYDTRFILFYCFTTFYKHLKEIGVFEHINKHDIFEVAKLICENADKIIWLLNDIERMIEGLEIKTISYNDLINSGLLYYIKVSNLKAVFKLNKFDKGYSDENIEEYIKDIKKYGFFKDDFDIFVYSKYGLLVSKAVRKWWK